MKLFHDIPESQGVANAMKRARQLVELWWTPIRPFPHYQIVSRQPDEQSERIRGFYTPWRAKQGMVYSSVRQYERFVGYNISLETFMTALSNPNSVLYTRPQYESGPSTFSFYGIVCSCFVSYTLNMPYMVPCAQWPMYEGVSEVDTADLDNLKLGDIVLNTERHVTIITDILRDADGHVREIHISESTPPLCVCTPFTPQCFCKRYIDNGFRVYRYAGIHDVPYIPSPYVHLEGDPDLEPETDYALMPDFGNKANYLKGIELVEITVLEDGWEQVAVTCPDGTRILHNIDDHRVRIPSELPGYYTASCARGETESRAVEWCVVNTEIALEKEAYVPGEPIRVCFRVDAPEDTVCNYIVKNSKDLNRGRERISAEAAAQGEFVLQPDPRMSEPDTYSLLIVAQNKYGQYASARTRFRVEEE